MFSSLSGSAELLFSLLMIVVEIEIVEVVESILNSFVVASRVEFIVVFCVIVVLFVESAVGAVVIDSVVKVTSLLSS